MLRETGLDLGLVSASVFSVVSDLADLVVAEVVEAAESDFSAVALLGGLPRRLGAVAVSSVAAAVLALVAGLEAGSSADTSFVALGRLDDFSAASSAATLAVAAFSLATLEVARLVVAFFRATGLVSSSRYGLASVAFAFLGSGDALSGVARFRVARLTVRRLSVM